MARRRISFAICYITFKNRISLKEDMKMGAHLKLSCLLWSMNSTNSRELGKLAFGQNPHKGWRSGLRPSAITILQWVALHIKERNIWKYKDLHWNWCLLVVSVICCGSVDFNRVPEIRDSVQYHNSCLDAWISVLSEVVAWFYYQLDKGGWNDGMMEWRIAGMM